MTTKLTPRQQYQLAWRAIRHFRRVHDWNAYNRALNGFTNFAHNSLRNREHPLMGFDTRQIHKDNCRWDRAGASDNCYSFYGICGVLQLDAEIYKEQV